MYLIRSADYKCSLDRYSLDRRPLERILPPLLCVFIGAGGGRGKLLFFFYFFIFKNWGGKTLFCKIVGVKK